jgi:RNA polymerase sporulation-specific sigma factor
MEDRDMGFTEEELEAMNAIERARNADDEQEAALVLPELKEEQAEGDACPEHLTDKTDEEIVAMCQAGDPVATEYLLGRYKNFVRSKARSYFLIGADHEDIVQEGMIGLYKAIRDYRLDKLSSFRAFAELCITRQIITAIKTATRQKHIPLNSYVSLNKPLYDEESDRTLLDVIIEGRATNPEDLIISQEDLKNIHHKIGEVLSPLEQEVLNAYLDGKSYQEIADNLGRHVKSIDNALQRVKRKLEKYLEDNSAG